jgi:hypothetical protein
MMPISEYESFDGKKTSSVYYRDEKEYVVETKSDTGTHYSSTFKNLNDAEDYAEDWVLKT